MTVLQIPSNTQVMYCSAFPKIALIGGNNFKGTTLSKVLTYSVVRLMAICALEFGGGERSGRLQLGKHC